MKRFHERSVDKEIADAVRKFLKDNPIKKLPKKKKQPRSLSYSRHMKVRGEDISTRKGR